MKKASDLVRSIVESFDEGSTRSITPLYRSWSAIAGDDIAHHSQVVDIVRSTLVIRVDHPGWMYLISMKKRAMLSTIRRRFPQLEIRSIRIVVGDIETPAQHERKAAPRNETSRAHSQPPPPSADLHGRFERAVERIRKLGTEYDD